MHSHTGLSVYSTHALIGSRIKAILDVLHHRDLDKNVDYFYNHPIDSEDLLPRPPSCTYGSLCITVRTL